MNIPSSFSDFQTSSEKKFLQNGFAIGQVENMESLNHLRETLLNWICEKKELTRFENQSKSIDLLHESISAKEINEIRMHLYSELNSTDFARPVYYSLAKKAVDEIVGNELVMQNRINVSIMMPGDKGSNVPLHIDAHSGESPFQCVLWLPMSNVSKTKGVFILPSEHSDFAMGNFAVWMKKGGSKEVFKNIKSKLVWPEVPWGSYLLFSSNLIHGSVPNESNETRFSLNARFKSLFSPYGSQEKGLGTFYHPIITRAATKAGLNYSTPEGLSEN